MFSPTAHERAERSTSQRADTVGTETPDACQRQIAVRTSPGVSVASRRRASVSARRAWMTGRCETTVAGFHRCGASKYRSSSSPTVRHAPAVVTSTPTRPVGVDQLPAPTLRVAGVAVHGERPLHAPPHHRVEPDHDADLPHPRRALPDRAGAPLRPGRGDRGIPMRRGHPYSYRDSYRDGPPPRGRRSGGRRAATSGNGQRARRDSNPQPSDPYGSEGSTESAASR